MHVKVLRAFEWWPVALLFGQPDIIILLCDMSHQLSRRQATALCALVSSIGFAGLAVWSLDQFLHADSVVGKEEWSTQVGFTATQFWLLVLHTCVFPLALVCLVIFAMIAHKAFQPLLRIALFVGTIALLTFGAAQAWHDSGDLLVCGVFCFDHGTGNVASSGYPGARYAMNLIYFILCDIFIVVFLVLAFSAVNEWRVTSPDSETEDNTLHSTLLYKSLTTAADKSSKQRRQMTIVLLAFLLGYPLMILGCMALPNMWTGLDPDSIAAYQDGCDEKCDHTGSVWYFRVSQSVYLTLYADVFAFYLFIYAVISCCLLVHLNPRLQHWMGASRNRFMGITTSELLFWFAITCLLEYEFYFWYFEHGWKGQPPSSYSHAERLARTTGQLSNIVMGLLLFPTSRNSLWSTVFGMPYEAMVRFHRILGYMFLGFVLIHVISFSNVFHQEENSFPRDIVEVPTKYHGDDFTIPLIAFWSRFLFLAMGVLSFEYFRRRHFEWFYWSHFIFMGLFIAVLWHAPSAWYFVLSALVLWVLDHLIRFFKNSSQLKVKSMQVISEEIVEISFHVQNGGAGPWSYTFRPLQHEAGQYAFFNIPELSQLAWHPFTIASAPEDDTSTVFIKAMGPNSLTAKLCDLVSQTSSPSSIEVNIDGPYGMGIEYSNYRRLLFVAGGIGVTPTFSHMRHIARLALAGMLDKLVKVRLVWVVRDPRMFGMLDDTWSFLQSEPELRHLFEIELFRTTTASEDLFTSGQCNAKFGRPDIDAEVKSLQFDHDSSLVFVCGPNGLSSDCLNAAIKYDVEIHQETFEF